MQIKRVALAGGTPLTVCVLQAAPLSLSWEGEDLIFGITRMGVMRVPAAGGTPQRIIAVGEDESARYAATPSRRPRCALYVGSGFGRRPVG